MIEFRIGRGPVYPGALVHLASGEEIFLSAIQKSNSSWVLNRYSRADRLIAEMNEYVRRVRSGQGSGDAKKEDEVRISPAIGVEGLRRDRG